MSHKELIECPKCEKEVMAAIHTERDCPYCNGTGIGRGDPDTSRCISCGGRGTIIGNMWGQCPECDHVFEEWELG